MSAATFEVRWGVASDAGARRAENQDAALTRPPVFAVADGMGGHEAGRAAADRVVEAFGDTDWGAWASPAALAEATDNASARVRELAGATSSAPGSTVTGVGLALQDGAPAWLVFNVGDSRTYLLRNGTLELVTVDHSQQQALIEQGMSAAEARSRARSNVITKAIGGGLRGVPLADQWLLPAQQGDRVLMCSDGLTGELSDALIAALLLAHPDPDEAARELVAAAVESGGRDNVTVVVVEAVAVTGPSRADAPPTQEDTVDEVLLDDPLGGDTRPDAEVLQS